MFAAWAFAHDVPRAQIRAAVGNVASIKTAGNAGFRFEGISRRAVTIPGRQEDCAVFSRLPDRSARRAGTQLRPASCGRLERWRRHVARLGPGDQQATFETENDEQSRRWSFTGAEQTPSEIDTMVTQAHLNWLVGGQAAMAVVDTGTGQVAGNVTLRRAGPPGVGGIGYAVHPAWRGRGYTSRALRLIRAWALNEGGFNRLELGAKRENVASQRAARSGGFLDDGIRIGRLRNPDGSFSDEIRFVSFSPL